MKREYDVVDPSKFSKQMVARGMDLLESKVKADTRFCLSNENLLMCDVFLVPQISFCTRHEMDMNRWPKLK